MDEAGRHLDRARDAFLHGHHRTTALEFHKAAIMMKIDAAHERDRADSALLRSAQELEHLAHSLLSGQSTDTVDNIDAASSRALTALAAHEHAKAALAWKQHHPRRAGRYLRSAADNLERASYRARSAMSIATADAIRNSRVLSGKLIDDTGYVIDEVGMGIDAMGHQIERFGHAIMRPLTERR
ncbi:MAG: putative periplasmic protein [Planctomycetaceae bacterium]|nr:putative periplasmic protein [Planctomycetaceae bacterium]